MSIPVVCPSCAAKYHAPDADAGQTVICPRCSGTIAVPSGSPGGADISSKPVFTAAASTPAPQGELKTDVAADDETFQPAANPDPTAGWLTPRNVISSLLLVVALGGVFWVYYDKFGRKDDTPQDEAPASNPSATMPANPIPPPEKGPAGAGVGVPAKKNPGGKKDGKGGENARAGKVRQTLDEYAIILENSTQLLKRVADKDTAQSAARGLLDNAKRVRDIGDELKGIGQLTADEAAAVGPLSRPEKETAHKEAFTKAEGVLKTDAVPTDAKGTLEDAMKVWGQVNVEFAGAARALAPPPKQS